ncbi:MAG: phosphotransferase [Chloroflexota bacterium]
MPNRQKHQPEVRAFLQEHLSPQDWQFSLPNGWGKESYFAQGNGRRYFVKVGVQVERYLAMAEIGLTPPVILHGQLESGQSIIVQSFIVGRRPSRSEYRKRLAEVAKVIRTMHNSPRMRGILQAPPSESFLQAGLRALDRLRHKWERHRAQVPDVAGAADDSLERLSQQVGQFSGEGLVASHGDICNANWLFASDGRIYLIDFDLMSMDDPALDMGAVLWWYYPPELRESFLDIAGYRYDEECKSRMRVRMAMHCLDILLPRDGSFDKFEPDGFGESLRDFEAALEGRENPAGYGD